MTELVPQTHDVVVALDIGTTKVCCLAGRKNTHGKLEILGVGKVDSVGVLRGVVSNIEKTVNAIREAVDICERQARMKFRVVHVGIAGQHIKSLQHRGILTRESDHTEIARRDIDRLVNDMFKLVLPPGDKIIHVFPQEFTVDNEQGITDPIGMCGVRLEANFHIITGQITAVNNIFRCIEKAGLQVAELTLEPIASADAVLFEEEKQAGVALVDIGGGTTDITIFHEGIIRHTAVIPFGGNVITADIKEGCTVMQPQAEKLKVRFGSALATEVYDNRIITIPGLKGREHKEISEKNLARIIQARMEELLDYVLWEIRRSGYERKLIGGIVITGGGALLNHLDKLTEFHTGMSCRVGLPVENLAHGYRESVNSPIYSTAIGLLLKGLQDVEAGRATAAGEHAYGDGADREPSNVSEEKSPSWLDNVFRKTKEWFEAEPDVDFNKK
ncbi:MAG: cell division protein FtsA [Saprospirales bacterium]|nr:cell division protein FtsA [Saprospirales bacterium]